MSKSIHDQVIEVLQKTNDGNNLAPEHLALIQHVVNGMCTEAGEVAFQELYQNVINGYKRPWFHDIEHLTKDHVGYVYWKDNKIEHYSFADYESEKQAATELAQICGEIEESGGQVTIGSVMRAYDEKHASEQIALSGP